MDADHRPVDIAHPLPQFADLGPELHRHGKAGRVGDVYGGGSGFDGRLDHFGQVTNLGAAGVFRGKLHVIGKCLGIGHRLRSHAQDRDSLFFQGDAVTVVTKLFTDVNIGGANEDMDPKAITIFQGCIGCIDITRHCPGQTGHHSVDAIDDPFHRLELHRGRDRKPGLDDIHPQQIQLPGDLHLFRHIQRGPGRLFAIPQCSIENNNTIILSAHFNPP